MDDNEPEHDIARQDDVICEFFGIKITTKNPKLAKVLKADVNEVLQLDVSEVKNFIKSGEKPAEESLDDNVDTKWSSISDEVDAINELLTDDKNSLSDEKAVK